ncbi:hypothetical protein PENSPDRAFT_719761, partial [Peniophora sp. CONT]
WLKLRDKYLKPAAEVLLIFNDAIAETASYFPAVPGGKAIFVAFRVLLEATKGVDKYLDALTGLFEELNAFLESLRGRLASPSGLGPASKTVAVSILAQLVNVCFRASSILSKRSFRGRFVLWGKALVKDNEMQTALQRLRDLTQLEVRAIAGETQALVSEITEMMGSLSSELETLGQTSTPRNALGRALGRVIKGQKDMIGSLHSEKQQREKSEAMRALEKLKPVVGAGIENQHSEGCMKDTRIQILKTLRIWSHDPTAPRLYWLNGMAGTGKSAIARTFCHYLREDGLLGGSFFCSRVDSKERDNFRRIIPTLAVDLARYHPAFCKALIPEIEGYPSEIQWNLQLQIERLFRAPLARVTAEYQTFPTLVLVVDALDECSDGGATGDLLLSLVTLSKELPIKFFFTSRPEPHIRAQLESLDPTLYAVPGSSVPRLGCILRLHDIDQYTVSADISLYLTRRLREPKFPFSTKRPLESDIATLVNLSGKLFIFASTAAEYVRGRNSDERLAKLTKSLTSVGRPLTDPLDAMYRLILSEAVDPNTNEVEEITLTCRILAILVAICKPLTVASMSVLLSMSADRIRISLDHLHAVIYVPIGDNEGHLSVFHTSFSDFLKTASRAPEYMHDYISRGHFDLAAHCLAVLRSERLCFNVAQVATSYRASTEQPLAHIDVSLRYACLYWSHHVLLSGSQDILVELDQILVGPKFLFWLEVLSAVKLSKLSSEFLISVANVESAPPRLIEFLDAAIIFTHRFSSVIERSIPHIYLSALALCDRVSAVYRYCSPVFSDLISPSASPSNQSEVASSQPRSLVYSPDGLHIAAGFLSGDICIWDAHSGIQTVPPLSGHSERVQSIAYSSSGSYIVSGSFDQTIRLWDTQSGQPTSQPLLIGHTDRVHSVAFTPDDSHIVSASDDGTILIWDAHTGEVLKQLRGHPGRVWSIALSPNGKLIASGSDDGSMCIWKFRTGRVVSKSSQSIAGSISAVAFSSDGKHTISGSQSGRVCVQKVSSGTPIRTFTDHSQWVRSVICSSDGTRIVSGSMDGTVRIENVEPNQLAIPPIETQASIVCIALSSNGTELVSAHLDGNIRIWSITAQRDNTAGKAFVSYR